jgi:hypothetical protein
MLRLANFTLLCGVLGAQRPAWPSTTDGIHNFGLWDLEENNQPDMNRSADELAVHYLNPIAEDIKRLAPRLKVWASPYAVYNWTLHNRTVAREHGQLLDATEYAQFWSGILKTALAFDFIAPQDSVGWMGNMLPEVAASLTALRTATAAAKPPRELWSNVELFEGWPAGCWFPTKCSRHPASIERIAAQIGMENKLATTLIAWSWGMLSPSGFASNSSATLYQDYVRYLAPSNDAAVKSDDTIVVLDKTFTPWQLAAQFDEKLDAILKRMDNADARADKAEAKAAGLKARVAELEQLQAFKKDTELSQHRRVQATPACDFAAQSAAAMDACCPVAAGSGGGHPLQLSARACVQNPVVYTQSLFPQLSRLKTDDRAMKLQQKIDASIASGRPATIEVSGIYNFSRASLLIAGAKDLTLQPAPTCVAPGCVPQMLFTIWPCGETEGQDAKICRPVNFNDPTTPPVCKSPSGKQCTCADVIWSSGVNITNSMDVTVKGIAIDYSPRGLGSPAACKLGPPPAPPPRGTPTVQFNSGRKFSYMLFNSSRVVTEDLTIRSAPFMAITSFLGEGAHVFRRVRFAPNPADFNAMIALKDGLHESDVRTGLQFIDGTIHGTVDDFFNLRNTLQLVYRCDTATSSCLIINPHIDGVPLNTVYGSGRVMTTVRSGDRFSFYPLTHQQHPENSTPPVLATMRVAAKAEVTDAATLARVSAWSYATAANKTNGLMHFGDGSDLWNISFDPSSSPRGDFAKLRERTLVNIDSISGSGAVIRDSNFSVTACNLGRTKSSNSVITGTTFSKAKGQNLEVTGLQIWFEGPLEIKNVSITVR